MLFLLVASAVTYLLLGDLEESLALVAAVLVVVGITLYQENKTERTLFALRELSSPRALVVRDGERTRIAGRDVVRGDVPILGAWRWLFRRHRNCSCWFPRAHRISSSGRSPE
jgi:Ca2+-transporting ATPase